MAGFAFPGTPPSLTMYQAVLEELDDVNGYIDGLMSGLATRYDLGSEQDVVGRLTGDRPVGRADFRTSLFAEMAEGDGILLDASPDGCAAGFTRVRCLPAETGKPKGWWTHLSAGSRPRS
jgi:hypothetical protein